MKHFITISFAVVAFVFLSCQKEIIYDEAPTSNFADSNYLNKVYYYDSSAGARDTFRICAYYYDNAKRVTLLTDSLKSGGLTDWYSITKYYYSGNDPQPYRSDMYRSDDGTANPALMDTTITFYTYNSAGKNTYDSSIMTFRNDWQLGAGPEFETYKRIQTYQYDGNKIYGSFYISRIAGTNPAPPGFGEIRDTANLDASGNITSTKEYDATTGQSILVRTSDFTYDNKPSPYARLSNFRTIGVFPFGNTFSEEMQSTNNRLKALEVSPTNGVEFDEDLTGLLSYHPNGYLYRIMFPDPVTPTIIQFTYRSF